MDETTLALLGRCYEAIIAPNTWTAVLDDLSLALGAAGACFNTHGLPADRPRAPASTRYRAMLSEFVNDGWAGEDLRARRGWPLAQRGQAIVYEDDVTTADERATVPLYRDLFARHGMEMFAGVGLQAGARMWTFNVVRSSADGAFDTPGGHARLTRLRPALARMLHYADKLADTAVSGTLSAFDHAAIAAIFIDENGRPRLFNRRADALMGRDLKIVSNRLVVNGLTGSTALGELIARVSSSALGAAGGQIVVRRENRTPLIVEAIPVRRLVADAFGRAGCLLFITDLENETEADAALLARTFNLTQRETEVAGLLRAGRATPAIAGQLGLRPSSVQQLIKSILAKAGASRQAELVALLGRLPGA